jgi:hypothetical protein
MAGGRPPKWKDEKELKDAIDAYFMSIKDEKGEYIKPPTITGLAIALGTNRETLCNYEEKEQFFDTIKEAKSRCEEWVEQNALIGKANATFSIFNLKNNYGWKDKTESEVKNTVKFEQLSDEDKNKIDNLIG